MKGFLLFTSVTLFSLHSRAGENDWFLTLLFDIAHQDSNGQNKQEKVLLANCCYSGVTQINPFVDV